MKIPSLLLPFIFLAACQSSLISDLVTQPGQIIYHEEFTDKSGGWIQSAGSTGSTAYADGGYQITVAEPGHDIWAVSRQAFSDARVEADATRLGGPLNNRFGLICRYQDEKNFYYFYITSDGYYAIGKFKDGSSTLLGQEMMAFSPSILTDGVNRIRFDCSGSSLKGFVNEQMIAITSDADFSNGDAGLIAGAFTEGEVIVGFDNFRVIKPQE